MTDTQEDKRMNGRRKQPRRMADVLIDKLPQEEKQIYDSALCIMNAGKDRRVHGRRSGADRREGD